MARKDKERGDEEWSDKEWAAFGAQLKNWKFVTTGRPTYALTSFIIAVRAGVAIPKPVRTWLAEKFERWFDLEGKQSLDAIMGLQAKRGKYSDLAQVTLEARNETLCNEVASLRGLGISLENAVAMVVDKSNRISPASWQRSWGGHPRLSEVTLARVYKQRARGKKPYVQGLTERAFRQFTKAEQHQIMRWFLQGFPASSIPDKLKHFLLDEHEDEVLPAVPPPRRAM